MRTIETKVYFFDELSKEGQKKAIDNEREINVDREWWDTTYEDAEQIGLKLEFFDLDRNRHATGEFILSASEVAQNILTQHGENCGTYKTAENFLSEWNPVFANYMDETSPDYESRESEEKLLELEAEFLKSLLEDYSIILQKDCEYLQSAEAIIETLKANDYEFTENGKLV